MNLDIQISRIEDLRNISGVYNQNIKTMEEIFECVISITGEKIVTNLDDKITLEKLELLINKLVLLSQNKITITPRDIIYINNLINEDKIDIIEKLYKNREVVGYTFTKKPVYPKTLKQIDYVKTLDSKDLVFSVGPAGTGKTYLAVIDAITKMKKSKFKKIILTRPAVEAGENLGFLPGDLKEKIDPYLRPLYDALYDSLGIEQTDALIEKQVIEIAPLAYMRGRTLNNAYVILDEAQNTTGPQMKMFLTRLGFNSKMVITGDISQTDLPKGQRSGLSMAVNYLKNMPEIGIVEFERMDIVRHPLVLKILKRYEEHENKLF